MSCWPFITRPARCCPRSSILLAIRGGRTNEKECNAGMCGLCLCLCLCLCVCLCLCLCKTCQFTNIYPLLNIQTYKHVYLSIRTHTIKSAGVGGVDHIDFPNISSAVSQFVILFYRPKSPSFRGLYAVDPVSQTLQKIYGRGPRSVHNENIEDFLKYETSSRGFKKLQVRTYVGLCIWKCLCSC